MNPIILYNSILTLGTLTAAYTAAGYAVANIKDYRPYTLWKGTTADPQYITVNCGSARAADALGICGHNLNTINATVSVENSPNGSTWTNRLAGFIPASDDALLKPFTANTQQYWRIKITGHTAAPYIGVAMIGARITFPYPPDTPHTPIDTGMEASANLSETGHLLGNVIKYKPYILEAQFSMLERTWVINTFKPFWDNHASNLLPFFWAFDTDNYATLAFYAQLAQDARFKTPMTVLTYIDSLRLVMRAVL